MSNMSTQCHRFILVCSAVVARAKFDILDLRWHLGVQYKDNGMMQYQSIENRPQVTYIHSGTLHTTSTISMGKFFTYFRIALKSDDVTWQSSAVCLRGTMNWKTAGWLVGRIATYQIYQNSIHTSRILTMQHGRQIQNTEEILMV